MIGRQIIRRFTTSVVRRSEGPDCGGRPGANIPFSTDNRYKVTAYFILFFGSAFAIPFIAVRHQMLK